ncbi:hypothetical protein PAXRUDRAFT_36597 [Paxillus rubicundulus Ve08.2h10]|uniref:CxC2-like cysteine cluster KDZ transposase-associated domain-containing protein n=1 Tax=Paxillus rubicundulus Ve08.2h10 TaxID=930991 RepID=A0A0D0D4S2_9AGAM|nr:hypothetical protein PAXRUDRAFT_36597 [Paxillus rubicundulus Ve08.2h10]
MCHVSLPLHHIKKWNSTFFEEINLKLLGLFIRLGHPPREHCIKPMAVSAADNFIIIESNSIHDIGLIFCGCETAQSHIKQLLLCDPHTAATFGVLKQFHLLSFKSKISTYEFYHALKCCSDNTGLSEPKDHYEAFMQMIHEWQHLKMMKQSGRAHDPDGPENTWPGDCVVMCPTFPHPRINLLENWETVAAPLSWLYTLVLTIDANFRLKHKNASNNELNPSQPLNVHLQKGTCSGHTTVNMADTKVSHGLAATGIGTVGCSHHGLKPPCGVRDLQKGEKVSLYLNMDYMFFSVLQHHLVKCLFVLYDIACQWSKKLWTWILNMPPALQFNSQGKAIESGVQKFHLPAHKAPCQMLYSLKFL